MNTPWELAGDISVLLSAGHALSAIWYQPWAVNLRRRTAARPPRRRTLETEPDPGPASTVQVTVHVRSRHACTVQVVTVSVSPDRCGREAGR
ncbi:hypothetical protein [Streptomyces sp. NPDC058612]|uniref:hypothetical protein n=1 Tax=Streptomyces sp. NPDC058612 TaxID=3346555 RepID=UPI0036611E09